VANQTSLVSNIQLPASKRHWKKTKSARNRKLRDKAARAHAAYLKKLEEKRQSVMRAKEFCISKVIFFSLA
jgi:hypothetical protein